MSAVMFRAVVLATVSMLILAMACGDGSNGDADAGLSRVEVESIVRSEMERSEASQPGLTQADVERIAQATVADRLTYEDVETIMRESMADISAMTPGNGGLTSSDVDEMIRAALDSAPQPEPGLSEAEVERIVRRAIENIPQPQPPEPGLTRAEVERIARAEATIMPPPIPPEPGLTRAEVAQIAQRVAASIPPRSEYAEYTRFFVDNAIAIYEADGLDDTLSYYNTAGSVDGQWYTFIIDENGEIIGHYDPDVLGQNLDGAIGTDAAGYRFGPDMLAATEEGKWVSYVFKNPATSQIESKHSWVIRHDDLLLGSGWYTDPANYTKRLVDAALAMYEEEGLEATLEAMNSPDNLDGQWYVFAGTIDGEIIGHYDAEIRGQNINGAVGTDVTGYRFGPEILTATEDGKWVSYVFNNPATEELGSKHSWAVKRDGYIFASGWYADPASYTKRLVDAALAMYAEEGLEATLAHYNMVENVDGQWYVFVGTIDGEIIGHYDAEIRGQNINGAIGTDVTGYRFGPEILTATEDGKWVSYVFNNPATGNRDSKHTWVVKRDGMIFGSGWHEAQN